mgnify:CR=1 FL=1
MLHSLVDSADFFSNQFTLRISVYPLVGVSGTRHKVPGCIKYFHQAVYIGKDGGAYGLYHIVKWLW